MAKLFTHGWYAKELKEVNRSIVDILTGKEPAHIYLLKSINTDPESIEYALKSGGLNNPDDQDSEKAEVIKSGKVDADNLAINYAYIHSIPPLIVDAARGRGYSVYSKVGEENNILTAFDWKSGGFYDSIKIYPNQSYIWDGTVDELLQEFKSDGFVIKDNLSHEELSEYLDIFSEENPGQSTEMFAQ